MGTRDDGKEIAGRGGVGGGDDGATTRDEGECSEGGLEKELQRKKAKQKKTIILPRP